jgi:hypothetical protein
VPFQGFQGRLAEIKYQNLVIAIEKNLERHFWHVDRVLLSIRGKQRGKSAR